MVAYVVTQNHADATKVFAAGASSGACMTQALLAAYPDVFAGGSVLAGVPAGRVDGRQRLWLDHPVQDRCPSGRHRAQGRHGLTGTRPRLQLWHGTGDTTLTYSQNFPAEVLQWTNVLGVTDADSTTSSFKGSQDTWARISYKNAAGTVVLETNVAQNAPHDLSGRGLWPDVVRFFGLDVDTPTGGGGMGGAGNSGGAAGGGGKPNGGAGGATTGGAGGTTSTAGRHQRGSRRRRSYRRLDERHGGKPRWRWPPRPALGPAPQARSRQPAPVRARSAPRQPTTGAAA